MDTMTMAVSRPLFTSRHCFSTPTSKNDYVSCLLTLLPRKPLFCINGSNNLAELSYMRKFIEVAVYKVKSDYLVNVRCTYKKHFSSHVYSTWENFSLRNQEATKKIVPLVSFRIPFLSNDKCNRLTINSASASDTGLEKSKPEVLVINDREITVESREDEKIHVRVVVSGEDTERTFDDTLTNLANEVKPVPGFRRQKGGKTGNIPKYVLLKMLGRSTVRSFVIKELITSTLADYTKQENLNVKDELNTKESAEELDAAFEPGKKFSFSAVIELEEELENKQEEEAGKEEETEVEIAS